MAAFCILFYGPACAQQPFSVRVAILQNVDSLSLKVSGFYEIKDPVSGRVIAKGKNLKSTVTGYKGGILLAGINFNSGNILISTNGEEPVIINGRIFRGAMQFLKDKEDKLLAINRLELEDYIKGILYHEASHYWPMQALCAQAIVCRTYTVYQCLANKAQEYDLTNDVYSQVYGGQTSERYRTSLAVDQTRGIILTFKGRAISAYYHATCAGHTEDASLLWNINIPPLKGVACGFCKESPHFNWHYVVGSAELQEQLSKAGFKAAGIKSIAILGRDKSGRITDLKIVSAGGEFKIPAKVFRNIIGPDLIRSTNFTVSIANDDLVFEGLGWGHGVGMCQWGAYFMARKGSSWRQILKFYYPESQISSIAQLRNETGGF